MTIFIPTFEGYLLIKSFLWLNSLLIHFVYTLGIEILQLLLFFYPFDHSLNQLILAGAILLESTSHELELLAQGLHIFPEEGLLDSQQ